jgi:hypothetical protein
MALEDEHRESLAEQPETSLANKQVVVSVEAASEHAIGSDRETSSNGFGDSKNTSDSSECVKIGAEAALADMSYDLGQSTMMNASVVSLQSLARYFLKGFTRAHGEKSVPDPQENEEVVFDDFFVASLRIPPHPILLDTLCKF